MPERLPPILEEFGRELAQADAAPARSLALAGAALATAAAVALTLALALRPGASSEASAATVLRSAAAAAAAQRSPLPRPDQFFYVRRVSTVLLPIRRDYLVPMRRVEFDAPHAKVTISSWEAWSQQRTGAIESRVERVSFPTAAARARWVALGRPRIAPGLLDPAVQRIAPFPASVHLAPGLTLRQLFLLPADARVVHRRLFGSASPTVAFDRVQSVDVYPISAALRASIYRALTLVPGIRLAGRVRSIEGRIGKAIAARDPGGGSLEELIIDPRTGELLGARTIVLTRRSSGLAPGTVRSATAIVRRAVTDSPRPPR